MNADKKPIEKHPIEKSLIDKDASSAPDMPFAPVERTRFRAFAAGFTKTLTPVVTTLFQGVSAVARVCSEQKDEQRSLRRLPLALTAVTAVAVVYTWRTLHERLADPLEQGNTFAVAMRGLQAASSRNVTRFEGAVFAWFCRHNVPASSVDKGLAQLLVAADAELYTPSVPKSC